MPWDCAWCRNGPFPEWQTTCPECCRRKGYDDRSSHEKNKKSPSPAYTLERDRQRSPYKGYSEKDQWCCCICMSGPMGFWLSCCHNCNHGRCSLCTPSSEVSQERAWYCCGCKNGPLHIGLSLLCIMCQHSRCSRCVSSSIEPKCLPSGSLKEKLEKGIGDAIPSNNNKSLEPILKVQTNKSDSSPPTLSIGEVKFIDQDRGQLQLDISNGPQSTTKHNNTEQTVHRRLREDLQHENFQGRTDNSNLGSVKTSINQVALQKTEKSSRGAHGRILPQDSRGSGSLIDFEVPEDVTVTSSANKRQISSRHSEEKTPYLRNSRRSDTPAISLRQISSAPSDEKIPNPEKADTPMISLRNASRMWKRIFELLNQISRPPLRSGYRRIKWTCDCGEELFGDFKNDHPEALNALAGVLQHPAVDVPSQEGKYQGIDSNQKPTAPTSTSDPDKGHLHQRYVPHPVVAKSRQNSLLCATTEKYFELCINVGEFDVSLAEIGISTPESQITTDGHLFQEIKTHYNKHRGLLKRHSLYLFKPVKVYFVQFCLEDDLVGILEAPLSFPSDQDIKSKEWEFCPCPCPLKDPPPIPNNVFMHYLNSPASNHPRDTWLNRLPKKLNSSIYQAPNPSHIGHQARGWGIQIIEGPNKKAMLWLTIAIVLTSFVAASLWAFLQKDVQGAFGIAGYLVASESALLVAVLNYY